MWHSIPYLVSSPGWDFVIFTTKKVTIQRVARAWANIWKKGRYPTLSPRVPRVIHSFHSCRLIREDPVLRIRLDHPEYRALPL